MNCQAGSRTCCTLYVLANVAELHLSCRLASTHPFLIHELRASDRKLIPVAHKLLEIMFQQKYGKIAIFWAILGHAIAAWPKLSDKQRRQVAALVGSMVE
jgi:hypothetical protein